ncbi:hypothetical protein CG716_27890 [Mycolicibacterium sphagni]|jgi:hypothetical protein|uniref:LppJ protein n=2 Tax=Mycolicibacterium sphagni TaxID=1786 RepID=A0A255D5X6_9MYCO|nr:hypothetical protein [Mycolicibacterium sphagni]OYN74677.1 hypothetical protein CG716_27890 [Mycolicibacterium sphagni]
MQSDADRVSNPLTPEQSRTQVMDAAHDILGTLNNLQVVEAFFWRGSCNDQGDPPFRGEMRIAYPPAASFAESESQIAQMVDQLRHAGWGSDPDFHSHGTVLTKGNVVAIFGPQNVSTPNRDIQLLGECRDVTTTKDQSGKTERVTLP